MKLIDISTPKHPNTFTKVDDCDYEELSKYKWCAADNTYGKIYVKRGICINGKKTSISMHSVVIGRIEGLEIDHITGDTLDNQRHNLRHSTRSENARNQKVNAINTSGYKGVYWYKNCNKWCSRIRSDGKRINLGYFTCLIKAARAYDKAAIKYHGEFARLNFPIQPTLKGEYK